MNTEMPNSEAPDPLEDLLKSMRPTRLSDDLLSRLNSAMLEAGSQPLSVMTLDDTPVKQKKSNPFMSYKWGWAAALAILGSVSALLVTEGPKPTQNIAQTPTSAQPGISAQAQDKASSYSGNIVPVAYDGADAMNGTEMGISPVNQRTLWLDNESPHKYIKVNYTKTVQCKDKEGRDVEVTFPATRFLLVPDEAY